MAPNFTFGYIFLVFAFILILSQILGYNYQEVVHRIESVLEPINKISRRVVQSTWARKSELQEEKKREVYNLVLVQFGQRLLRSAYVFIALLSMSFIPFFPIFVFTFFALLRTFYGSIIIWRGQLPFHFTVIDVIDEFIRGLYFKEIALLFYPFTYFYKFLSVFQIDLGGIDVTCSGAQLPLILVVDLVVYTLCLFIICTDFQVYADMFADIAGNWAADVHTDEEYVVPLCDIFVSWGLRLVSKLYPVVSPFDSPFDAPFDAQRSLVAYAYVTTSYLIWLPVWLMAALLAAAICLVVDAFHIILQPISLFKWFVSERFSRIVRASVCSLLSFTPLQRCELLLFIILFIKLLAYDAALC